MSNQRVRSIDDIARLAEVSPSTVSRALNDSPHLSEATKARVKNIARMYGFSVNAAARNLRIRRSEAIAFVVPSYAPDFYSADDLFGRELLGGISGGLQRAGYDLLVIHADPDDTDWAKRYLEGMRADGFIIMASNRRQQQLRALDALKAPFIAWGVLVSGLEYCSVTGDNVTGGRIATRHLVDRGCGSIGFLGGPEEEGTVRQRLTGYESALRAAGREPDPKMTTYGDYTYASGVAGMNRLLARSPRLDAVLATGDLMAIGAIRAIHDRGLRVPQDVAVVGYDDLPIAAYTSPSLTTVRQDFAAIGKALADNLIQNIKTGAINNVITPVELVIRDSA
jgi:Transcriptional regulators